MSDEAATALVNLDGRKFRNSKSIIDVDWATLVKNDRYLYELLEDKRAGEVLQNHGHHHGEMASTTRTGLTRRRTVWSQIFPHRVDTTVPASSQQPLQVDSSASVKTSARAAKGNSVIKTIKLAVQITLKMLFSINNPFYFSKIRCVRAERFPFP